MLSRKTLLQRRDSNGAVGFYMHKQGMILGQYLQQRSDILLLQRFAAG